MPCTCARGFKRDCKLLRKGKEAQYKKIQNARLLADTGRIDFLRVAKALGPPYVQQLGRQSADMSFPSHPMPAWFHRPSPQATTLLLVRLAQEAGEVAKAPRVAGARPSGGTCSRKDGDQPSYVRLGWIIETGI